MRIISSMRKEKLRVLFVIDVLILMVMWVDIVLGKGRWGIFWLTFSFMLNMLAIYGAIYGKRR